jgi:hypothetical protein
VRDYGAVGDGVADDYPAIQRAIAACGTSGGTILFPPGTYRLEARDAGGLKLPAGNRAPLVLSGYGAVIELSEDVPRFLDFDRTADHQTFARFTIEGFAIDAGAVRGNGHVIGFTAVEQSAMSRINVEDIVVRDVRAYNIHTDTASPHESVRQGLTLSVNQWEAGEPTTNRVRRVLFENVRVEGGTHGFSVGGTVYGLEDGWPQYPGEVNIEIDDIRLRGCSWDSGVRTSHGWVGDGMIMGGGASCGSLYVSDCDFRGSGDNNYEINGWRLAIVTDCVSEDARFCGYFFGNHGWPLGGVNGQRIVWRDCVHRGTGAMPSGDGWVIGTPSTVRPLGTLVLERCSVQAEGRGATGIGFLGMTKEAPVRAIRVLGCAYSAAGMRATADAWPTVLSLRCGGSPADGPTQVSIEDTVLRFSATKAGAEAYVVRLVDLAGDLTWSIRRCRFDATTLNGSSGDVRLLTLGEALPSTGFGMIEDCAFAGGPFGALGVVVADASSLRLERPLTVRGCDFHELDGGQAIYVTPGDPNATKLRLIDNVY